MGPSTKSGLLLVAGMMFSAAAGLAQGDSGLPAETLAQATPLFAFQSQGNRSGGLVFIRSGNAQGFDPRVFVGSRDGWRLIELSEQLHNTSWVFVGRSLNGGELWGITQASGPDGPGTTLQFVSSGNGGRSWKLRGTLVKASRFAVVDLFSVNEDDKGTLFLRLDDDPSPEPLRLGYYFYLTKNGGRNWSEAIFSQNRPLPPPAMLAPADRTFEGKEPLDVGAWQRLLAELQPAE